MNKIIKLVIFSCLLIVNQAFTQGKSELISFSQLEEMLNEESDNVYIVNFWATWCGPCLAELPAIQRFYEKNTDSTVKLLLVSFDFPNEIKKVNKFIERKNLKPKVYLISDTDQNAFIDKVSKNWQGTIPATWFVNNHKNKKILIEKPLNEEEINRYLNEIK
ncbi:MAG: TlpA family protein disulfide reductase [Bacteroidota bacterium]